MTYVATVWHDNAPPALDQVNLGKMRTELASQAAAQGIAHTLPVWTNGIAPYLDDSVPWNEIERVVDLVAESLGLSYTPTVWGTGWTPARNATNLNKIENQLVLNSQALQGTPPPPTVSLFSGLATRMISVTGSTVKVGDAAWQGGSTASQNPHIWGYNPSRISEGVYTMTDSCTVISDPTYGKVFRFNIGPGDTNPYFNQPTKPNGELTIQRPIAMGQVDWYGGALKILSPYTLLSGGFNVVSQYGYPALASPPLSISFDSGGLGIDRHVGTLIAVSDLSGPGTFIEKPRFWPVATITGMWVETVIGVKWAVDSTGWIEVWARVKALGETVFTQKFIHTNTPTFQVVQGQSVKTSANDKMGLYFGTSSSPPTNTVHHRGFERFDNKASAIVSMG